MADKNFSYFKGNCAHELQIFSLVFMWYYKVPGRFFNFTPLMSKQQKCLRLRFGRLMIWYDNFWEGKTLKQYLRFYKGPFAYQIQTWCIIWLWYYKRREPFVQVSESKEYSSRMVKPYYPWQVLIGKFGVSYNRRWRMS
jgi:hypothetical protein